MSAINLHVATVEQLQLLPQIGIARAKRIIDAREEDPLTMERLVEVTNISQDHWGNLLMDGKVTLGVTAAHVTLEPESNPSALSDTSPQDITAAVVSTTTTNDLQLTARDDSAA